jgi:hypothetical protein
MLGYWRGIAESGLLNSAQQLQSNSHQDEK